MSEQKIVIYHLEGRRSFRVVWTCEELELPYHLAFRPGDLLGSLQDLRAAFPPMPMYPVVQYGDQWLVESGGIVETLIARDQAGRLVPDRQSPDYAVHAQWMHFAEGTALSRFASNRVAAQARGQNVREVPSYRAATYSPTGPLQMIGHDAIFDFIEGHLAQHAYFGGERFSGADIMMHYSLRLSQLLVGLDYAEYPSMAAWVKSVEARPAFARATAACTPEGANEYGLPLGMPLPIEPPARA